MNFVKYLAKNWLPPIATRSLQNLRGGRIRFKGEFATWEEASKNCMGYGAASILAKVLDSTLKVKRGEAAYERDSVVFNKISYPYPLISIILLAAIEHGSRLNVLDFGGALGSSYFQCKNFLTKISPLRWCVIEQAHYVECGLRELGDDTLRFYDAIENCIVDVPPNVIIASSVLQYMQNPFDILEKFINSGARYIVIDRTPIAVNGRQVISVQLVPSSINLSSYPIWLFEENKLLAIFLEKYELMADFNAIDGTIGNGHLQAHFKGFILRKKQGF